MALTINADSNASAQTPRQRVIEEILSAMVPWDPGERMGAFQAWLRGSLSLVHLHVLTVLETKGSLSMSHLAEALDVSVASATGIVGRMEERGLVARQHDREDRRIVLVSLTRRGSRVFEHLAKLRRRRLAAIFEHLSDEELDATLTGMRAMRMARLKLKDEEAAR